MANLAKGKISLVIVSLFALVLTWPGTNCVRRYYFRDSSNRQTQNTPVIEEIGVKTKMLTTPEILIRNMSRCFQPMMQGTCKQDLERWYYDSKENRCIKFKYTGCKGNDNIFTSEEKCKDACRMNQRGLFSEDNSTEFKQWFGDRCGQNYSPGHTIPGVDCEEQLWYHDKRDNQCHSFTMYCGEGTANRFPSRAECRKRCPIGWTPKMVRPRQKPIPPDSVCRKPRDQGKINPDNEYNEPPVKRVYFDRVYRGCFSYLYYGGTDDDWEANNFDSYQTCRNACGQYMDPKHGARLRAPYIRI